MFGNNIAETKAGRLALKGFFWGILMFCGTNLQAIEPDVAIPFEEIGVGLYLSNPHCKAMGDLNGDGYIDLVVGGTHDVSGIVWYEYVDRNTWQRHVINSTDDFTTSAATGDVDADGDLDIIIPSGVNKGDHVWWFENPRPAGDPRLNNWVRHDVGLAGSHDVRVGDLNRDSKLDIVAQKGPLTLFHQNSPDSWNKIVIEPSAGEGTALGDLDGDGDLDIAIGGAWYETPADPVNEPFAKHTYASDISSTGEWSVHIDDINQDARNDIMVCPSDSAGNLELRLYLAPADPKNGTWTAVTVFSNTDGRMHGLDSGDIDDDGDIDIVTAEMEQTSQKRVLVARNNGDSLSWDIQVVANMGSHELHMGDVDDDNDMDLFGVNHGNNDGDVTVYVWRNLIVENGLTDSVLNNWQRHEVDSSRPWRSIFITSADIDKDGFKDIVTGGWWYRNPQTPDGLWQINTVGASLNNMAAVYDFDADGDIDILGTAGLGSDANDTFYWGENNGQGTFTIHNNVDAADGNFLQGTALGYFQGNLDVALSWHNAGSGIQTLTVPVDPKLQQWRWERISLFAQGEDLSKGDIDSDGDEDLLLGTQWLRNEIVLENNWWNTLWRYRVGVTIDTQSYIHRDKPVEVTVNFTQLFNSLGESRAFDVNSLRVVEVNADGVVIDSSVPFQFDTNSDFDPQLNAAGTLIFIAAGLTQDFTNRYYHIYFDVAGKVYAPSAVSSRVTLIDGVDDEGLASFEFETQTATYYYQKEAAGFSSLMDQDGNDWINYNQSAGSAGSYRGIPNLIFPEGEFHPGATGAASTLRHLGPIKATIHSQTNDGKWECLWEIYPRYARLTVLKADHDYWFLYEGTPGGSLDLSSDIVVRSDGTEILAEDSWTADLVSDEWVYFGDPQVGRSLFVAHHDDDEIVDSYYNMQGNMTVFGFGRQGSSTTGYLSQVPAQFTLGLMNEINYVSAQPVVESSYNDVSVTIGVAEQMQIVAGTDVWTNFVLYNTSQEPDRNRLADINRDGRLDAVVGYEAVSMPGKLAWYEQPLEPTQLWTEHLIDNVIGPMSLDVADMDHDGDIDVVVGEHNVSNPETARVLVYENVDGFGTLWRGHLVYMGDEHHDGTQLVDVDNDQDLDIISIGWTNDLVVLYENRGGVPPDLDDTTPPTVPQGLTQASVTESAVSLTWQAASDPESGINHYIIYRDNVDIGTTNLPSFTDIGLTSATTYTYEISAVNGAGLQSERSDPLIITTLSDTTPAHILSVEADLSEVVISFSEALNQSTAEQIANYVITGSTTISVYSASLLPDQTTVALATSEHAGGSYTLDVSGVDDLAGNTIVPISIPYEYVAVDLTSGLIAHWPLNEASGAVAIDQSANGNDATINGAAWTSGYQGAALFFDGSDDYVDAGSMNLVGNELTLSAWVNAAGFNHLSNYDSRIISKALGVNTQDHYWMLSTMRSGSDAMLRFRLKTNGATDTLIAASAALPTDTWVHAAAVYDGSQMRLYKDGIEVGSMPKTGTIDTGSASVWLGNNPPSATSRPWNGIIDDVRVYERALDAAEIAELAAGTMTSTYTLTISKVGEGQLSPTEGQHSYIEGTSLTLTASPAPGWSFSGWSGDLTSPEASVAITMDTNKSVIATFSDATAPSAPTALAAVAGDNQVELDWADNVEVDLAGYNVYRGDTTGVTPTTGTKLNLSGLVAGSAFVNTTAVNGTTYYYVVTAIDMAGNESAASNEDAATPLENCLGDLNSDKTVDVSDLAIFVEDFGKANCSTNCEGDFNTDGDVDGSDLKIFDTDLGRTDCL